MTAIIKTEKRILLHQQTSWQRSSFNIILEIWLWYQILGNKEYEAWNWNGNNNLLLPFYSH